MLLSKVKGFEDLHIKMDSADNRFFEGQLEAIDADLEREDLPGIEYQNYIPTVEGYDQGAVADVYRMLQQHGYATLISDKAQNIPLVNVSAQSHSQPIMPVASGYGFGQFEILSAQKAGVNLQSEDAMTALEVIERFLDETAFIGNTTLGVKGLFNHASVHSAVAANGAAASPLWSTKTSAEKLADLVDLITYPKTNSLGVEIVDTVVLSPTLYADAQSSIMGTTNISVLNWFKASYPQITAVLENARLTDLGTGTTDVMVSYRKDKRVMKFKVPCGLITLPAQYNKLMVEVYMFKTVSGLELRKPMAVNYKYGCA